MLQRARSAHLSAMYFQNRRAARSGTRSNGRRTHHADHRIPHGIPHAEDRRDLPRTRSCLSGADRQRPASAVLRETTTTTRDQRDRRSADRSLKNHSVALWQRRSGRRRDRSRRPPTPPDGPFGIRRFLSTGQNLICDSELCFVRCVAWRCTGHRDLLRDFRPLSPSLASVSPRNFCPNTQRAHVTLRS